MKRLRYVSALAQFEPGDATKFIKRLRRRRIRPGHRFVIWCRVSRREQYLAGRLDTQLANLRRIIERVGGVVVAVVVYVGSGKVSDHFNHCENVDWLDHLARAAAAARKLGATLVAESTDRFVRHAAYHSARSPRSRATDDDLRELEFATSGVKLMTLLPPNATLKQVERYRSKRGQRIKCAKGGRPRATPPGQKKRRRVEFLPRVLRLRRKGWSIRRIGARLQLPTMTVSDWIKTAA